MTETEFPYSFKFVNQFLIRIEYFFNELPCCSMCADSIIHITKTLCAEYIIMFITVFQFLY